MNKLEYYQKHYFSELDRREQLNGFLSIPLGVLSLLSGALVYLISNYSFGWNVLTYIFCFLLCGSVISILLVVFFLLRSYWSYEYQYITDTEDILKYENELNDYYSTIKQEKIKERVEKEIEEMIIRKYSNASTFNAKQNAKKSANLHKSNTAIVSLIIFLLLSAPIYFWNYQINKKPIVSLNCEVNMSKDQDSDNKKDVKSEQPAEKPKEPDNKFLREFSEKEKKNKQKLDE